MSSPNLDPMNLIQRAYETFKVNPGLCIGMWFVYSIFNSSGNSGGGGGNAQDNPEILIATVVIGIGCCLLSLLLAPAFRGGYQMAMLRMVRGDTTVEFSDIFAGFSKYLNLLLVGLMLSIGTIIGFLLLIVPGIIVVVGFFPAYLLVMEEDLGPMEALTRAWELTDGHKLQIFVYFLVAFLLNIGGLLACCVGVLVTAPIGEIGAATAYDELRKSKMSGGLDLSK